AGQLAGGVICVRVRTGVGAALPALGRHPVGIVKTVVVIGQCGERRILCRDIGQPPGVVVVVAGGAQQDRAGGVAVAGQAGPLVSVVLGPVNPGLRHAGAAKLPAAQPVGRVVDRGEHAALGVLHLGQSVGIVIIVSQSQTPCVCLRRHSVERVVAAGVGAAVVGSGGNVAVVVIGI